MIVSSENIPETKEALDQARRDAPPEFNTVFPLDHFSIERGRALGYYSLRTSTWIPDPKDKR